MLMVKSKKKVYPEKSIWRISYKKVRTSNKFVSQSIKFKVTVLKWKKRKYDDLFYVKGLLATVEVYLKVFFCEY
jgi:hypothetical protein